MSKPIFVMLFGFGWSATSPLAYTLQRLVKYCHGGYTKNFGYLFHERGYHDANQKRIYNLLEQNKWENYQTNRKHHMNLTVDLEPLKDFPLSHLHNLVYNKPRTINNYISFYKALYNHVSKKGYKAVADYGVPFKYIKGSTVREIQKHFHLKGIRIARDPIRRAFSAALSHKFLNVKDSLTDNGRLKNPEEYVRDYIKKYKNTSSQISDNLLLVMEELWEGDGSEKKKLEDFIDQPIPELWTNLYAPDKGHHLTWDLDNTYCPCPCQVHGQDTYELTPDYYIQLRETTFKPIYDSWLQHYGSLPLHWGQPIDYSKNL